MLSTANGPWDQLDYTYDGVGNRTSLARTVATTTTTDNYSYGASDNRLASIAEVGGHTRSFTHDAAGNVTYDNRSGGGFGYTYNAANRMDSMSINGVVQATYKYNALGQQVIRDLTQAGQVIHSVFDLEGNRIAEYLYDDVAQTVRRQSFWFQRLRNLSEYQVHLVGFIMRRSCGVASAGFREFCV